MKICPNCAIAADDYAGYCDECGHDFFEPEKRECPHCHQEVDKEDLAWVNDRYGIPFKKVCPDCYDEVERKICGWEFDEAYAGERLEEED